MTTRKLSAILAATIATAGAAVAAPAAEARPYLHLEEAQNALFGAYGSDCDLCAWPGSTMVWNGYVRYNGYDLCVRVLFNNFANRVFESYYPHASDTGPGDIYDAQRGGLGAGCPSSGVTQ